MNEKNEPYLLVDIGDHIDRSHLITDGTMGQANIDFLNDLSYDYVTIGNNEGITFSRQDLNRLYMHAKFKVLINNLYNEQQERPHWLLPYDIKQIADLNIGIIGTTVYFSHFYQLLGWELKDPFEEIKQNVQALKSRVDFIVLMSHLGVSKDESIAKEISGIDIILGAHTHHMLGQGLSIHDTHIFQTGRSGQYIGQVTIEKEAKGFHVFGRCIEVTKEASDKQTEEKIKHWEDIAQQALSIQIAWLKQEVDAAWHEESTFGNILAEALNHWCQTKISIVNSGLILDHLHNGKITKADLLRICPHPINPCVVELKGHEIWSIMERSLDMEIQQLAIKGFGFRGQILGMLSVDGLEIHYEQESLAQRKIKQIFVEQQLISADKTYQVATTDMLTFHRIFPELHHAAKKIYYLPEFMRDLLAYRFKLDDIESAKTKRWITKKGG